MKPEGVNPIFYGFVFLFIVGLHFLHITIIHPESKYALLFFSIHAIVQAVLEFLIIYAIALFFKTRFYKSIYFTFVSLVFTLLMIHVTDFVLVRIMGMTFFNALDLVLDETLENFIEMLQLTGIPLPYWAFFLFLAVALLPAAALTLYALSSRIGKRDPLDLTLARVTKAIFTLPFVLLAVDIAFLPSLTKREYIRFTAALPFKTTVLPYPSQRITIDKSISRPQIETSAHIKKKESLPNIYIWIVESLREDYLTEQTAPNVAAFRAENVTLPFTLSGGNGTQLSWYSIFHANHAIHWAESRTSSKKGAIPLQMFKEMGYSINLYAAMQLKYYKVDELLFGKDCALLSEKHIYPHYHPKEAYESDLQAFSSMMKDIKKTENENGNIFLLFLDSTHFEYSWPPEYPAPFSIVSEDSHVQLTGSDDQLKQLKNRYKNSIHFADSLFGLFVNELQNTSQYGDACIIFTGDHGEEFYEEGRLYHASHLSSMQTTPPIYYKLGKKNDRVIDRSLIPVSSHVDIMPTLLDHVTDMQCDLSFCDGTSLLREKEKRYAVVARYNGNRTPYEFYVHDGKLKCLMQFDKKKGVYSSKGLHIIHLFDRNETELETSDAGELLDGNFKIFFEEAFKG